MPLTNYCLVFTLLIATGFAQNYFCDFKCGAAHTVCARPNCEPGIKCGNNFQMLSFTDEDRSVMLALHNDRRNYVASGNETRFGNGKASNMNALSYSKELEFVAQCWANNCELSGDKCRSTKKIPGYVGQNRKWYTVDPNRRLTSTSFLKTTMPSWYKYIKNSNAKTIDLLSPTTGTIFTQLMFAKTTHIGCGRVAFGNPPDDIKLLIVCNYGSGHLSDEPVYLRGEPCSDCSKCNTNYTSLCGEIEDLAADTWRPPKNDSDKSSEDDIGANNSNQEIPKIAEDIVPNDSAPTENYFCEFECGKDHTVCVRPKCEPKSECGSNFKYLPFNDEDRKLMLALHNERRNYVASGKETRYGNGQASNMEAVSYSKEIEYVAQCWANSCDLAADKCGATKKFPGDVGQNRKWFTPGANRNLSSTRFLNDSVSSWYEYINLTNSTNLDLLAEDTGTIYTQLMWAKTTHIGCGRVAFGDSPNDITLYIVCNYGLPHVTGEPVYLRGEPCSDCSTCNDEYTSLCGEVEDFSRDIWTSPNKNSYISMQSSVGTNNRNQATPEIVENIVPNMTPNESATIENYFCDFNCGKDHTVCTRPNCEVGSKCGSIFKFLPFNDEDRSVMLALHNERRNYIASGQETTYGNSQASNMNALSYSKELEYVAQCWANNCEFSADKCRSTKKFPGHVGQNRKWFNPSADSNLLSTSYLNDTVPSWYEDINLSNSTTLDLLTSTTGTIFTQLMWAKTTHIGCGRVAFGNSPDDMKLYIICNYGVGHVSNEPVYLRGEPCSDCIKCNDDYTSLCGEIEDFTKDTYTPPNNYSSKVTESNIATNNRNQATPEIVENVVQNPIPNDSATTENYFCDFYCGKDHTVCKRPKCEPGSECGSNFKFIPFNDEDRSVILALHNERRNYVASGYENRYGNGRASNMRVLSYSKEIEYVAQCWANSCNLGMDKCGATTKFPGDVGQSRKWFSPGANINLLSTKFLNDSVSSWYEDIKLSNASILDSLGANTGTIFTQLMWAKTTHIGCGRVAFGNSPNDLKLHIVCNYGGLHMTGEPVYLRGVPCSNCSTCNDEYTSLCGEIEDFTKDTWITPNKNSYISMQSSVGTNNRDQATPEIVENVVQNMIPNEPATTENYFCDFDCGKDHTVCKRPKCEPGSECGSNFKFIPFNDEDRSVILALHNERRNYVASGMETRYGNGQASNIRALSYSKEIEYVAQCWANSCDLAADICGATKKFPGDVGQNRKWFTPGANINLMSTRFLNDTVSSWYEDIKLSNSSIIDDLASNAGTIYTQLMWAKTTHIGCGRVAFGDSTNDLKLYIVCNYGVIHTTGEPVYLRGVPCSDCSTCNNEYTSLCGDIEDFTKDTWTTPNKNSYIFTERINGINNKNQIPPEIIETTEQNLIPNVSEPPRQVNNSLAPTITEINNKNQSPPEIIETTEQNLIPIVSEPPRQINNDLAPNITDINMKLQSLTEYTRQQEKHLMEISDQIKSSNQQIDGLKTAVDIAIKYNKNYAKLLELQKQVLDIFLGSNPYNKSS